MCPQQAQTCSQCTPIRYVYSTGFTAKTYKYYFSPFKSLAPPTEMCCFFLCAVLRCDMMPLIPLHLIIGCPPPPLMSVTPLVLHVILGQHHCLLPFVCPMTHWMPLLVVRVKAMLLLIFHVPITHPIQVPTYCI